MRTRDVVALLWPQAHICSTQHTLKGVPCSFLYRVIRQAAEAVVPRLQSHIRNTISYTLRLSNKRSDKMPSHASLRNLVHHMSSTVPDSLVSLASDVTRSLHRDSENQAILAVDMLALLLAPEAKLHRNEEAHILQHILSANEALGMPALRLKISNLLPGIAADCSQPGEHSRCLRALEGRLLDADAGVRLAAVRGVGEMALVAPAQDSATTLDKLLERLRDVAESVRIMVRCCYSC
jgi:hypothetical protein